MTAKHRALVLLLLAAGCGGSAPVENAAFVPVLAYRGIALDAADSAADGDLVTQGAFERQMQYLSENGYKTATVSELADYMRGELTLPEKTVVLTFDDAWDVAEEAASILDRYGLEGTFYLGVDVATESQLDALDWAPLRRIASSPSFEFGAQPGHIRDGDELVGWMEGTVPGKGPLDVVWQVEVTRQFLEMGLEDPVRSYAWPEGRISDALVELARKAGYSALVTRHQASNHAGADPLAIGRFPVMAAFGLEEFGKLLAGDVRADVAELLPMVEIVDDTVAAAPSPDSAPRP
jgi:hypothetical protein